MQDKLEKLGFIEIFIIIDGEVHPQGMIRVESIIQIFTSASKEIEAKLYAPIDYKMEVAAFSKGFTEVEFIGLSYASNNEDCTYIKINPNN